MKLHLNQLDPRIVIKSVGPSAIVIDDQTHTGSVLVSPASGVRQWRPQSLAMLTETDVSELLKISPELVLFGTGRDHRWPAAHYLAQIGECRIGVEVMSTPAACRTFNILASEGRNVLAALLKVSDN
jgi:uncharacterized protein